MRVDLELDLKRCRNSCTIYVHLLQNQRSCVFCDVDMCEALIQFGWFIYVSQILKMIFRLMIISETVVTHIYHCGPCLKRLRCVVVLIPLGSFFMYHLMFGNRFLHKYITLDHVEVVWDVSCLDHVSHILLLTKLYFCWCFSFTCFYT